MRPSIFLAVFLALHGPNLVRAQAPQLPKIEKPPTELKAPDFYSKYISASGYPILASKNVDDYALREAAYLVDLMLAKRPDVREAMIQGGSRMCIIAHNEFTCDLPEWEWMGDPKSDGQEAAGVSARDFWDGRARGMGGSETDPYCSCGEENLLGYDGDPYSTECILIHEFAHNIHLRGMLRVDRTFDKRLQEAYNKAMSKGLWAGKYASVNHHEYFAEGVQSWFDDNRENDHDHNHVDTRQELLEYDPGLAAFCREVFGDTVLKYTKPATRLEGHMAGYDPSKAPKFVWPERAEKARKAAIQAAQARSKAAEEKKGARDSSQDSSQLKPLTIDAIFTSDELNEKGLGQFAWRPNHPGYYRLAPSKNGKGQDVVYEDIETKQSTILVTAEQLTPEGETNSISISSFTWSHDEKKLLLFTNTRRVWRYHTRGDYWLYDIEKKSLRQLGGQGQEPSTMMFAKFSPDATQIAFVRKNNIYVQDTESLKILPITTGGSERNIYGTSDWVYEEELDLRDGIRWSPDSKSIAFWHLDATQVKTFHMINNTDDIYSRPIPILYPKVGQTNSACRIGVASLNGSPIRWLDLPGDPRNHYVAQLDWNRSNGRLYLQQFNRLQNRNTVFSANMKTGELKSILVEEDAAWLENENPFRWIQEGKQFLWISERSGWRSLYLVDAEGNQKPKPLIAEPMDMISLEAIDEPHGFIYFAASPKNATQRYLYRVSLDGGPSTQVTPAESQGWNTYQFSSTREFAVHTHSNANQPPQIDLVRLADHQVVRNLVDNQPLLAELQRRQIPKLEFTQLDIGQDLPLDAWYILPPNYDPQKKYPLQLHVYGEPHGQTVRDSWMGDQGLWHRMLAQQGMIVASIDNRGTMSPRGRAWRKSVHRQIGTLASADQAAATRKLIEKLPAIDRQRIGIWGWSGGGSMSLNAIFRHPDLYSTAIAVAPVPNQLLYDTIYQERYMGLPEDNAEGYREGSPITHAHNLQGDLLIIHGTGDDNCHYQGVELLMNELIKHNKSFQVMPYPNRSHSINEGENTTRHLYSTMTHFILKSLKPVPSSE